MWELGMCRTCIGGIDGMCLHAAAAISISGRPGWLLGNSGPSYRIQMVELMKYISNTSCLSGGHQLVSPLRSHWRTF
jgi:hypothetical protein